MVQTRTVEFADFYEEVPKYTGLNKSDIVRYFKTRLSHLELVKKLQEREDKFFFIFFQLYVSGIAMESTSVLDTALRKIDESIAVLVERGRKNIKSWTELRIMFEKQGLSPKHRLRNGKEY